MVKKSNANGGENLPAISPPRLPYHPAIHERFGVDKADWKALVEAIFPNAQSTESVILALSYCKARKLDPFKRCIHIVPIWDSQKRCTVDTIWPGIGELRTTAHRTKAYAGRDKTEFGPMIEETWHTQNGEVTVKFPEWAQVTVYRMVGKDRVAYAGPQVFWMETYASLKDGSPNSMWRTRPRGQIDKCAEAAALRAAFPEEVGNEYIDAEAHAPGSRYVESHEIQEIEKAGNAGVKERIKAQQQNKAREQEPDPEPEQSDPLDEERDPETEAKAEEQKRRLQEETVPPTEAEGEDVSDLF